MINTVREWMDRYFAEEEAVILLLLLALGLLLTATLGDVLAPLIAAAVPAFMIQGLVGWLAHLSPFERRRAGAGNGAVNLPGVPVV